MRYGEIVELGRHRLMCGDATSAEDVQRLVEGARVDMVLTDPPYGMKCQDKHGMIGHKENRPAKGAKDERFRSLLLSTHPYPQLLGDDSQDTARKHYPLARALTDKLIIWGGQYFAHFLPISGAWLFWNKRTGNNDFSDGELAWVSRGRRVCYYEQMWNGILMQCNYALNGRSPKKGARARLHPTQKPVELHARILEDFTSEGDTVLDCFGGSGTTLIACEITGRKCLMMELSPEYCDIIIDRYETLTKGNFDFRS